MAHIVIISASEPLRQSLSGLLSRELAVQVTAVEDEVALARLQQADIDVIVATAPLSASHPRAILLPQGQPRRADELFAEIQQCIADKQHVPLMLTDEIGLYEKARRLEHLPTGSGVELTEKEMALLLFVRNNTETIREEILQQVFGMSPDADTHTLESHLYRLRQKWRELSDEDCIVATKSGYRWYEHVG